MTRTRCQKALLEHGLPYTSGRNGMPNRKLHELYTKLGVTPPLAGTVEDWHGAAIPPVLVAPFLEEYGPAIRFLLESKQVETWDTDWNKFDRRYRR